MVVSMTWPWNNQYSDTLWRVVVALAIVFVIIFALFIIVYMMRVSAWLDTRVAGLFSEVGVEAPIYAVSPPPDLVTSLFWALIALLVVLAVLIVLVVALGGNSNNPI